MPGVPRMIHIIPTEEVSTAAIAVEPPASSPCAEMPEATIQLATALQMAAPSTARKYAVTSTGMDAAKGAPPVLSPMTPLGTQNASAGVQQLVLEGEEAAVVVIAAAAVAEVVAGVVAVVAVTVVAVVAVVVAVAVVVVAAVVVIVVVVVAVPVIQVTNDPRNENGVAPRMFHTGMDTDTDDPPIVVGGIQPPVLPFLMPSATHVSAALALSPLLRSDNGTHHQR